MILRSTDIGAALRVRDPRTHFARRAPKFSQRGFIIDPYRFASPAAGATTKYLFADWAQNESINICEFQVFAGGVQQTISSMSVVGANTPSGTLAEVFNGNLSDDGIALGSTNYNGFGLVVTLSAAAALDAIKLAAHTIAARVGTACAVYSSADGGTTWALYGHVLITPPGAIHTLTSALTIDRLESPAAAFRYMRVMGMSFEDTTGPAGEFTEMQTYEGATRRDSGHTWSANNFTGTSMSNLNDNDANTKPSLDTIAAMMAGNASFEIDHGADYALDGLRFAPDNRTYRIPVRYAVYGKASAGSVYTFRGLIRGLPYSGNNLLGNVQSFAPLAAMPVGGVIWNTSDKTSGSVSVTKGGAMWSEGVSGAQGIRATVGKSAGKWQWEILQHTGQAGTVPNAWAGIREISESISTTHTSGNTIGFSPVTGTATVGSSGASAGAGAACTKLDAITMLLDMDNGTLKARINSGTLLTIATGIPAGTWHPYAATIDSLNYDTFCYIYAGIAQQSQPLEAGYLPLI